MNRTYMQLLLLSFLFFGCSAPGFLVTSIHNQQGFDDCIQVYSLPKTTFTVHAVFKRIAFIPGPYHEYADKYLAIEGVHHIPYESWHIQKIWAQAVSEPDASHFYAVNAVKSLEGIEKQLKEMANDGMILLPYSFSPEGLKEAEFDIPQSDIFYKDLSVKRNLIVEKETSYKRVLRDSGYVQVPVETESLKLKTTGQKAEEAANFIIKLRKRRFKMLTGQNEGPVPGNIQASIDELNRIETEYLSLFIGKKVEETIEKEFFYTPSADKKTDEAVLFRIDKTEGIFDKMSTQGAPVMLKIQGENITDGFGNQPSPVLLQGKENMVIFRYPDIARLFITYEDNQLMDGKFTVFQFGKIIGKRIPAR
ncbi:MAG: DUF4831 family protein [Bacteroidales bacterium]|nr:DUF4831 family protein [Bacteroidales bacterium]